MELTQLYQFKRIAELQSVTAAARELYVSQPALTKSLKKLEAELGQPLFDRVNGRLQLNTTGETALYYVNEIFSSQQAMMEALSLEENENSSRITVATPFVSVIRLLSPLISNAFLHQNIDYITMPEHDLAQALRSKQANLVIAENPIFEDDLTMQTFGGQQTLLSIPAGNPLFERDSISFLDLNGQSFLEMTQQNAAEWSLGFYKMLHKQPIKLKIQTVDDYFSYNSILVNSDLIALSSTIDALLYKTTSEDNRRFIHLENDPFDITYHFIYPIAERNTVFPLVTWIRQNCLEMMMRYHTAEDE